MNVTKEKTAFKLNGFFMFLVILGMGGFVGFDILKSGGNISFLQVLIDGFIGFLAFIMLGGFYTLQPNESIVLNFFGKYSGSVRQDGFSWSNPLTIKRKISLRMRNFESTKIKVNDLHGNPIEIAAVIVWKVTDSASALFDVDNYEEYVEIQSETALRHLASHYPYDDEHRASLRGSADEVAETLKNELKNKLKLAGVEVIEAKLSHLAYAPEIAQAMLRRQQAEAVISARQKIVEGAVGMVEMALKKLSDHQIVELDDERKATMVNNLLVTLVSENEAKPVINTGTIY